MSVKENRPDVCATFGTANPICRNGTTDTRLGQVPYACSAVVDEYISLDGFADYCREQCITYDDVLRDSTLMYLSEIDRDDPPSQGKLKHALLAATNRCIEAYNMGEQNEAAPPGASLKDRFPSQKPAGERYKRLSGLHPLQIALVLRELHGALGIRLDESNSDENFDIGVFQRSGSKKGTYDTCPVSLERLIRSYRVAAIFTYQANEDMDEGGDEHSQELLGRCMDDYNAMFGTSFSLDSFDAYRKDITRRMKQKDLPQVDILLVVNMMLTGFDAKSLNTLYLDKNLIWHTLVQAYSRTNRVDKVTKQFGQIVSYRDIKRAQDDALRLFSGDGDPNEYLLESYEYYVNKWVNQVPALRKAAQTVDDAGQLQSEGDIRQFVVAFRSLSGTLATLKTFGKFDWADLSVVLDDEEYEGYKSWYLYYHDEAKKRDPKVPVPVDVDFDVELVRTDRINVMYILSLLKSAHDAEKSDEERARDIDLVMREIERSDNDALRAKKDIMEAFIRTRFYELPDDADIQQAYEQFERESLQAEIESFAYDNGLDAKDVLEVFSEYTFGGNISEEAIRRRLAAYRMGLLKITKMTGAIKEFVVNTYSRYKAEGE